MAETFYVISDYSRPIRKNPDPRQNLCTSRSFNMRGGSLQPAQLLSAHIASLDRSCFVVCVTTRLQFRARIEDNGEIFYHVLLLLSDTRFSNQNVKKSQNAPTIPKSLVFYVYGNEKTKPGRDFLKIPKSHEKSRNLSLFHGIFQNLKISYTFLGVIRPSVSNIIFFVSKLIKKFSLCQRSEYSVRSDKSCDMIRNNCE